MSKLTESFREVQVYNEFEFYGGHSNPQPHISYAPNGNARAGEYAHWAISFGTVELEDGFKRWGQTAKQISINFSHSEEFSRNGATHAERKAEALAEAIAWADKYFGKQDWVKDPYGGYGPREFVEARTAELRAMVKAKREQQAVRA